MNNFSKNLRTYLFIRDMTQKKLSEDIGVSAQALGKWLIDDRIPPRPTLLALANILETDPDDLVNKDLTFELMRLKHPAAKKQTAEKAAEQEEKERQELAKMLEHLSHCQTALDEVQAYLSEKMGRK